MLKRSTKLVVGQCVVLLLTFFLTFFLSTEAVFALSQTVESRPNILWIVVDDMSANFSCYGETAIETPHVDRLAGEGIRFARAYATAPVCSPFRSAMITGMYQTSIGAHHHRSGRGIHRVVLPDGVQPVPQYFQDAGYWTCIGSGVPGLDSSGNPTKANRRGKTDYNFDWNAEIYDSHDWADRAEGQPFFMQVQLPRGQNSRRFGTAVRKGRKTNAGRFWWRDATGERRSSAVLSAR